MNTRGIPRGKRLLASTGLDEPTNGLDFDGQREIYRYLIELRERGKTILITSHSKDEIKILCDQALIMAEGKLAPAIDS